MKQEKSQNIQVAIRIRPLIHSEIKKNEIQTLQVEENQIIVLDPIDKQYENKIQLDVYHRSREKVYAFDKVFTNHPIQQIFEETSQKLIKPFLNGYNGCVFAYGATGTGKTHTMLGNENIPGLINLSLNEIFKQIKENENEYESDLKVSYIEIYNEQLRDLLVEKQKKQLDLRDHPKKGVCLANAKVIKVEDCSSIMNLLYKGNERRITESTGANATSSRSHAIFQIYLTMTPIIKSNKMKQINSKLSLIDLAGSERGAKTQNQGIRMQEGTKINRSLLALANCINALRENKKGVYVNFRDSKLTRLLKDSLGGKNKTEMIVTISPAGSQFEETLNTLKYANRAKQIKTKPIKNPAKIIKYELEQSKIVIQDIKKEIQNLQYQMDHKSLPQKNKKIVKKLSFNDLKKNFVDIFEQRVQLNRALCELNAQNKLNEVEIDSDKNHLLNYTLSVSGQLIEKENIEEYKFVNLPSQLQQKLEEISELKSSINYNSNIKKILVQELKELEQQQLDLYDQLQEIKDIKNRENLEYFLESKFQQIQSEELAYNLRLQEKMNVIFFEEIKKLKQICNENNILIENQDDEQEEVVDDYQKKINENFMKKISENKQKEISHNFKKPKVMSRKGSLKKIPQSREKKSFQNFSIKGLPNKKNFRVQSSNKLKKQIKQFFYNYKE